MKSASEALFQSVTPTARYPNAKASSTLSTNETLSLNFGFAKTYRELASSAETSSVLYVNAVAPQSIGNAH
ncbi:MAG: hypothetical protein CM15mP81_13890 [Alphaproteobacteria bacterium]|nr:MAG: hypothetical protein CM15mP81_13890 [Alphaproteobacteria bacterium]